MMAQTRDFAGKANRSSQAVHEREPSLRSPAPFANQQAGSKQSFDSRFGHDFSRIRVHTDSSCGVRLQPKLRVGAVDDPLEHDADSMADAVMRMPNSSVTVTPEASGTPHGVQRKCACGGSCPKCRDAHPAEDQSLQMTGAGSNRPGENTAPPLVHEVLRSSGEPLNPAIRAFMEPRFGHDFSQVRVRTGGAAADAAHAVSARAYTTGNDIVFGAGEWAPGTAGGMRLLAHELAHVVQQRERPAVPALQRRVVDTDYSLPCRHVPGRETRNVQAAEQDAASMGDQAAAALRANPLAEPTRDALWRTFRLDYNDPIVRCRYVPVIAGLLSDAAQAIRTKFVRYNCATGTEDTWRCRLTSPSYAVTFLDQIDLCQLFWDNPTERAETILHEWMHYTNILTIWDRPLGGVETAGCYQHLAALVRSGTVNSPDSACELSNDPLPPRDPAKIRAECPRNVLIEPSVAVGKYSASQAAGGGGLYTGVVLNLAVPLTPLHRFDLDLGTRFTLLGNVGPEHQYAYELGLRAGLSARWRPWRSQLGASAFVEGGAALLPGSALDPAGGTSSRGLHPYYGYGGRVNLDLKLDKQRALELFVEVARTTALDTSNDKTFEAFSYGLGAAYRF